MPNGKTPSIRKQGLLIDVARVVSVGRACACDAAEVCE